MKLINPQMEKSGAVGPHWSNTLDTHEHEQVGGGAASESVELLFTVSAQGLCNGQSLSPRIKIPSLK